MRDDDWERVIRFMSRRCRISTFAMVCPDEWDKAHLSVSYARYGYDGPGRDVDLFLHLAGGLDEFFAKRDLRECSYTHNNKIFSRKKNTLCMGRGRRNGCCLDNDIRRLFEECSKVRVRSCAELPAELLCTFKNHIIYCSDFEVLLILCDHVTDISAP